MWLLMQVMGGVGIAANQFGWGYRVFVMGSPESGRHWYCFNPEIVSASEVTEKKPEGCLSFPDLIIDVERPESVRVRYQDAEGVFLEEQLEGLWARCFQHELDHLNGVCLVNKVSRLQLNMAKRKRDKLRKRNS
jgi:peptide deformylase